MKHLTLGLAPIVPVCADENPAKDTSGTNPTLLLRSVNLSNEYSELQSGRILIANATAVNLFEILLVEFVRG
jgi:hypothetical protein